MKRKKKKKSFVWRRRRRIRMITVSEVSSYCSSSNLASLSRLNHKSSSRLRSSSLYRASLSVSTKTRNTRKAKSWNLGLVINSRRYFFFEISNLISNGFQWNLLFYIMRLKVLNFLDWKYVNFPADETRKREKMNFAGF